MKFKMWRLKKKIAIFVFKYFLKSLTKVEPKLSLNKVDNIPLARKIKLRKSPSSNGKGVV